MSRYETIGSRTKTRVVEVSKLERIGKKAKKAPPKILQPVDQRQIIRMMNRLVPPEMEEEKVEVPLIPDPKKAAEDYNCIDYQIIAMNLWKNKARELF